MTFYNRRVSATLKPNGPNPLTDENYFSKILVHPEFPNHSYGAHLYNSALFPEYPLILKYIGAKRHFLYRSKSTFHLC